MCMYERKRKKKYGREGERMTEKKRKRQGGVTAAVDVPRGCRGEGGVTSRRHSDVVLEGAIRPWNAVDLFPARLHTHTHNAALRWSPRVRPGACPGADYTILIHITHTRTRARLY